MIDGTSGRAVRAGVLFFFPAGVILTSCLLARLRCPRVPAHTALSREISFQYLAAKKNSVFLRAEANFSDAGAINSELGFIAPRFEGCLMKVILYSQIGLIGRTTITGNGHVHLPYGISTQPLLRHSLLVKMSIKWLWGFRQPHEQPNNKLFP